MNCALGFCTGDLEAAIRWLERTSKQDQSRHDLFLLPARGVESPVRAPDKLAGWRSTTVLVDGLGVKSNWQSNQNGRDSAGPNSLFRQFARHFYENQIGSWAFMEPDAIPLCDGWLDKIEDEYLASGKEFMGALVGKPFKHMSGVGVYPENTALEPTLVLPMLGAKTKLQIAFDLAGARAILPRCRFTNLIQHVFRAPPFTSREDFEARVSKDAVIFHADKTGSSYQWIEKIVRSKLIPNPEYETASYEYDPLTGQYRLRAQSLDVPASAAVKPVDEAGLSPSLTLAHPFKKRKRGKRAKSRTPEQQSAINKRMALARAARKKA